MKRTPGLRQLLDWIGSAVLFLLAVLILWGTDFRLAGLVLQP